jgi:hypothetical protein
MGRARVCAAKEFAMKITVRKRTYQDGHEVLQVDINVIPAGSKKPERYRINVPQGITSKSGATRWGLEEARRIAVEGPPYQTRRARKERIKQEEKERAQRVPTLAEWSEIYLDYLVGERRKSSTLDYGRSVGIWHLTLGCENESTRRGAASAPSAPRVVLADQRRRRGRARPARRRPPRPRTRGDRAPTPNDRPPSRGAAPGCRAPSSGTRCRRPAASRPPSPCPRV